MPNRRREQGLGSLYQRGRRWVIQYYANGQRQIESTGLTSRTEAQKVLTARLASVAKGEAVVAKKYTVAELWANRLRYAKGRTVVDAGVRWKKLQPFFGGMVASQVQPHHIMQYRQQRTQQGRKVGTVNREVEALRRCFKLALRDRLIATVPHFHVEKENNVRTGYVPDGKLDQLREAAGREGLWLRTMLELGISYGWRRGEMLGLTCSQVDFGKNLIRLEVGTTKNREAREVPMLPTVRVLLQQCCSGKKPADKVLTRAKGQPVLEPKLAWWKLCVSVGLGQWQCIPCGHTQTQRNRCPKCNAYNWRYVGLLVHDLRRTAARTLRNAGIAEAVAMTITGHKTASMFRRYGIINNDDKVAALQQLQRYQQQTRNDCKVTAISADKEVAASAPASTKVQ